MLNIKQKAAILTAYFVCCPGARPIIAVGTVLTILIMSWSETFASGYFELF